ncbi:MAG: DNA polymerase III subunit alpha [Enterobacteriaceae bacterium]
MLFGKLKRFVHLRIHSDFSIRDGLATVKEIIKKATFLRMPSLGISDFMNVFCCIKFYLKSIKNGIKPVIGADILLESKFLNTLVQVTILALNNLGYYNLIKLISKSYCNKKKNYPVIDFNLLKKHNSGIIILSGGVNGDIGKCLLEKKINYLNKSIYFYKKYFYKRFYLELTRTNRKNEEKYLNMAVEISEKNNLPLVATNDVRFIEKKDFKIHSIRVKIYNSQISSNKYYLQNYSSEQYMKSSDEMIKLFSDIPESIINTVEIAKRCNVNISLNRYFFPNFKKNKISDYKYLYNYSFKNLKKKLLILFPNNLLRKRKKKIYENRLKYELNIINKMNFNNYFLIVMEFVNWAKKNNIPVGPGRGSGAGSLVAYSIGITDVDPIKFGLIFERFLNLERKLMPDFDIDFCVKKRDLVINHIEELYGKNSVSQIITFGTMSYKVAVRDVGRIMGYPYRFVDYIAKLIPNSINLDLFDFMKSNKPLQDLYNFDERAKIIIDVSSKLNGIIRNVSTHAGGIVISPTKVTDFTPIYYDYNNGSRLTQFDKNDIEKIGLVKFDFLGLKTLTVIYSAIKKINKFSISKLDLSNLNLNDKKIFKELKKSTVGIFQLDSQGMKSLVKKVKPDCFEDLVALIALYRPGPLQSRMVDNFINRKHRKEEIYYPDKICNFNQLRCVLKNTYGVILYQEQVMKIAQILAGYSLNNADLLRLAMGKKNIKDMLNQKKFFINGALKNGIKYDLANNIFHLMSKFAGYGFNKSHSVAYAFICYYTIWLKVYFPSEFMSSVITSEINNVEKIFYLIQECKSIGIKIISPNINLSNYDFTVSKDKKIVYGMGAIKGIGKSIIYEILKSRKANGNFLSFFDFCTRLRKKINRRTFENLIFSGALDNFGSRAKLILNLENMLKISDKYIVDINSKQIDMFESCSIKKFAKSIERNEVKEWDHHTLLRNEKKSLGLFLKDHPVNYYFKKFKKDIKLTLVKNIISLKKMNKKINVIGMILSIKKIITSNNKIIYLCVINDVTGSLDIILFKETFKRYCENIKKHSVFIITGFVKFSLIYEITKIVVDDMFYVNRY